MLVPNKETIRIVDNIDVVVPSSNSLMTPFVLKEQKDWFEDEIKFIRQFVQPGMNIIDIGANYGLYTLSCAKKMENSGNLWSFEPTAIVVECLQESLNKNNFSNTTLIKAGLSNKCGEAKLALCRNAELNSLNTPIDENGKYETIELKTLDSCKEEYKWENIDLIKLDAEGEEVRILEGGKETLDKLSPIIMYELKHGKIINLELINKFNEYGYKSYYLITGPMVLLPFNTEVEMDSFQLNLFAMKKDTANKLSQKGVLSEINDTAFNSIENSIPDDLWIQVIKAKNFSNNLISLWTEYAKKNKDNEILQSYLRALNLFAYSISKNDTPTNCLTALFESESIIKKLLDKKWLLSISIMHIRILFEMGKRADAIKALGCIIGFITNGNKITLELPFFPALKRYEHIDTSKSLANWLFSSLLEPFETKKSFSSYFSGKQSLGNLKILQKLGYCDEEIKRRIELLESI